MDLTDAQQRALSHDKSMSVTAGAGTGKTRILVEKYISLLEHFPDLQISDILALTFTEKAAAEMKQRIRHHLATMEGSRWHDLQDAFIRARISTFHSFAFDVLRRAPLQAKLPPALQVVEPNIIHRLYAEVFEIMINNPLDMIEKWEISLVSLLKEYGSRKIQTALIEMYEKRYLTEPFFQRVADSPEEIVEAWDQLGDQFAQEFIDSIPQPIRQQLKALSDLSNRTTSPADDDTGGQYLSRIKPSLGMFHNSSNSREKMTTLYAITRDRPRGRIGKQAYFDQDDLELLRASKKEVLTYLGTSRVKRMLECVPDDPQFTSEVLRVLKDFAIVYDAFAKTIDRKKRLQGVLDFNDLLNLLTRMIETNAEHFRSLVQSRIRFLLVDEYQDTNPQQYNILEHVLGGLAQATNSLFIVGDPKQSIYLFRDADVTLFKKTEEIIRDRLEGNTEYLDVNFRSVPEIVTLTNAIFTSLFASTSKPWEFGFTAAACHRRRDTGSVEMHLVSKEEDENPVFQLSWFEGEAVAQKINDVCEINPRKVFWDAQTGSKLDLPRPATYGDIAILLRRRRHLPEIEWALQRHGIPYHVHKGLGFYGRPEIKALCNILTFLANCDDDIALYGALRSPYFGFSDALLYRLSQSAGHSLWTKLKSFSRNANEELVKTTERILKDWLHYCRREPLSGLIQRILRDSAIYGVYAALEQGDRMIANVEKLAAMARDLTSKSSISLVEFVEELLRQVAEEPIEGEAQLEDESSNSVKILTVHAAKGLEFPVVIIPDLTRRFKSRSDSILIDPRGIAVEVLDPSENYKTRPSFLLRFLRNELQQKYRAEEGRLLYVALTRAKDHLIMVGRSCGPKAPENLESGKSWMDWLWTSMTLSNEAVERGLVQLSHEGKTVDILLTSNVYSREDLIAREWGEPHDITANDSVSSLPEMVAPLPNPSERLVISPSEINRYLENPTNFSEEPQRGFLQRGSIINNEDDKALRGTIIHEIFEGVNPDLVRQKYQAQISPEVFEEALKSYQEFRSHPIMQNIDEEYTELPLRVDFNGWTFSGKVDRLVRKKTQWILIDYKTGQPRPEEYRRQVTLYRLGLERILGTEVTAFIYLTEKGEFEPIEEDGQATLEKASQAAFEIEKIRRTQDTSSNSQ